MSEPHRLEPGPGQESVWDYPRPPRVEASARHVLVVFAGITIAETRRARRVLETSHPPVYYLPPGDVRGEYLSLTERSTYCEWKGAASYYTVKVGERQVHHAAWSYPHPAPAFIEIKDHLAFYPSLMDACYLDGEVVRSQPGDFYGGWITREIVGPFKGGPGTLHW